MPRFLNIRSQAQNTVATAQIAEINNTTSQWQSLGGQRAVMTGQTNNPYEYYYHLLFLSTQSDGTDPYRKLSTNTGGSITPNLLPTDTLGNGGSWTVCLPDIKLGGMTGTTPDRPNTSSLPDGFYGQGPVSSKVKGGYTASTNANGLYVKQGSQITNLSPKPLRYSFILANSWS